jgi:hypothetical protein
MTPSSAFVTQRRAVQPASAARNAPGPEPVKTIHSPHSRRTHLPLNPATIPVHPRAGAPPVPCRSSSLQALPLQRKLAIGSTTDPLEAEADRVASQVMGMSAPSPRSIVSGAAPDLRRKCACEGSGSECSECRKKSEEKLQLKAQSPVTPTEAPPIVHQVLRSPGQRLDDETKSWAETAFQRDFGHVRIHTDDRATSSAAAVGAVAYTVGNHLVFGANRYQPSSIPGRQLIAHELTHVLQQGGNAALVQRQPAHEATATLPKTDNKSPQLSPRYIDTLFESVAPPSMLNGATTFYWHEGGKEKRVSIPLKDLEQDESLAFLDIWIVHKSKAEALKTVELYAKEYPAQGFAYFSYYTTDSGVIMPTSFQKVSTPLFHAMWPDLKRLNAEKAEDISRGLQQLANSINPFPCTQVDEKGNLSASINLSNCALPILLHGYAIHSATRGPGSSGPKNEPHTGVKSGHAPDQVDTGGQSTVKPETKPAPPPPPKQAPPVEKPAAPPPSKQAPPVEKPAAPPPPKQAPPVEKPAAPPPPKQAPPVEKPAAPPPSKQAPPTKKPAVKPPHADTPPAGGGSPAKKPDTQPAKGQGGTADKPSAPADTTPDTAKPDTAGPDSSQPTTAEQKPPEADKNKTEAPPVDKASRLAEIKKEIAKNDAELKKLDGKIKDAADRTMTAGQNAAKSTGVERERWLKNQRRNGATRDSLQLERGKVRARNQDLYDEEKRLTRPPDPETWQQAEDRLREEFKGQKKTIEVNDQLGERDVDCYTPDGVAREAKHGGPFDITDSRIQLELNKDIALLKAKKVTAVEWHFYKNPETGGIGPTARLEKALSDAGIKVVRH